MPAMDFDIITLGHGSGGLLSNKLLDSGVFSILKNDLLEERHDGAVLPVFKGAVAFTTDSFVVSPIFFPGGNIGELAVNGTVNDLNMCGAKAKYLSLSFIIEEGLRMDDFWEILLHIKAAADDAGVLIVTGDTKVVEKGKGDQLFINTSGIGEVLPGADIRSARIQSGDKILISGDIGRHGIAIMSVREGLEFETVIESDTCHFNGIVPAMIENFGDGIHLLRDATRGGLATVLNEVARDKKCGITINQKDIQVEEDVAAACEILGLDPLYVANEGVFVAVLSNEIADECLSMIQQWKGGRHAAIIGEVVDAHRGQVILNSQLGGKRVVNMLLGEQLPRIC